MTQQNAKIKKLSEIQKKIEHFEKEQMANLSDLQNVKNFLRDEEVKRLDLSKKAKKQIEDKMKNSSTASKVSKSIKHFVDAITQSSASE